MVRKLAIKRLTASDLTFFKWHYENHPAGKQKAINLDAKILVGQFFPYLGEPSEVPQPRFPQDLYLFGPGLVSPYNLQRKILKQEKNWRLNGEYVDGPEGDSERYNVLKPGDYALFDFYGDTEPKTTKVVLIAQEVEADAGIHAELSHRYDGGSIRGSMRIVNEEELQQLIDAAAPPVGHALYDWVASDAIEDAALGGEEGVKKLLAVRGLRGVSPEEFLLKRKTAERVGILGEELLNDHFNRLEATGIVKSFEWTSSINAIAPYDFRVVGRELEERVIDAKSTSGDFLNPIHMSLSEVRRAVEGPEPYDIYRLYRVSEGSAKLRKACDIGPYLTDVLAAFIKLPLGFQVDGVSIKVSVLPFVDEEILLEDEQELAD